MSSSSSSSDGTPWVERYRPQTLDDVSHQTEVVSTLKNAVRTGRLPHLLLYGPPGSGKTSVALALCKELWHPTQWRRRVLELNASDERGISVVREKIKQFASLSVGKGGSHTTGGGTTSAGKKDWFGAAGSSSGKTSSTSTSNGKGGGDAMDTAIGNNNDNNNDEKKYPNPPFKVIILDEADTVTKDAQAALRRIIEAHSRITRFILICNYVTRIIEPLASRCAKFRFQALPPATMKDRVTAIARAEGRKQSNSKDEVVITERQIDAVLAVSGGDMRRAVTSLQSVQALLAGQQGSNTASVVIDEAAIYELAGLPPDTVIDALYRSLLSNKFDTMQTAVTAVINDGYSVQTLLQKLLDKFIETDDLDELGRAQLAIRIAEAEDKMNDGADEYLQLMTVCGLALRCLQHSAKMKQ